MNLRRYTTNKPLRLALSVMAIVYSGVLMSEEKDIQKDPVAMPVGPFEFAPLLEIAESYDDNIFQRNVFQKSSFINQIHAGGQLSLERQLNRYLLTYVMQSSLYHDSPQDDYVDNYVGMNTHTEFTSRNRLDFGLSYLNSHYTRGTFLGRDLANQPLPQNEPDQYHMFGGDLTYRYGHPKNRGNLEMKLSAQDYSFDNNFTRTAQQERTQFSVTPGFYYRLMPNTRLLTQVETAWLNHKDNAATDADYIKQRFLVGATWLYSTKTVGTARIGYLRQDYVNNQQANYNGITWDLNARWLPLSYSKLDLSVSRDVNPSVSGVANIRESDRVRLGWIHDWSSRITTQLNGAYESALNSSSQRQDDYMSLGVDLNYGFRRWLGVGVSYNYRTLQSSDSGYDFDQNVVMINITGNPRISDEAKTPWASWY